MPGTMVGRDVSFTTRGLVSLLACALALVAPAPAHANPFSSSLDGVLLPVALVAAPFFAVHEFIYGSNEGARRKTQAEADKVLLAHPGSIPANGLHTGSLPLTHALHSMLVESRLPFIEIDTAGSVWFLKHARNPKPLIALVQRHRHIRLALGEAGHPDCIEWNDPTRNSVTSPPVRPGRCLRASFVDELASDTALEVDTSAAAKRRLQWILKDRASGRVHLAAPFWESQTAGKPLEISAVYRGHNENYTFVRVLRKLAPLGPADNRDGSLHLMRRIEAPKRLYKWITAPVEHPRIDVLSNGEPPAPASATALGDWEDAYALAYASGKPVVYRDTLLIDPQGGRFGPACVELRSRCEDGDKTVAVGSSLLTVHVAHALGDDPSVKYPGRQMQLDVVMRNVDNRVEWHRALVPKEFPEPARACQDLRQGCSFHVVDAGLRGRELFVRGKFVRGIFSKLRLPQHEVELVAPLP